jgi:Chemotaxis protein; stimulates methylation of MCP proteins
MVMPHPIAPRPDPVDAPCGVSSRPALGERQHRYLLPGELHVSADPCQIRTILGSCVAICLWDDRQRAGGMNHFLLPVSREGYPASSRFADVATRTLLETLQSLGCRLPHLQAKIFGGSCMFRRPDRPLISLGEQNVSAALDLLRKTGIPVVVQETGGTRGRKIMLNTDDGVVWCQRI